MTPNLEEDAEKEEGKPSEKTEEEKDTSVKKSKPDEEIDYKLKFSESAKEAIRLREEVKKKDEQITQSADVMQILYDNPTLLKSVQDAYDRKYNPQESKAEGVVADKVLDSKIKEKISSVSKKVSDMEIQLTMQMVDDFCESKKIDKGSDEFKKMLSYFPAMRDLKLPFKEGLEKAWALTNFDKVKETGKTEALRDMFTKSQASAGGGSSAGAKAQPREAELSSEERKVADGLGIKYEEYRKSKKVT